MVIRVYISGNSGNKEIVTHQQRIFMILNSLSIPNEPVDISAPGMEKERDYMREKAKKKEGQRHALPPQIFNDKEYRGDYDDFDIANEDDKLEEFLGILKNTPAVQPEETKPEETKPVSEAKEEKAVDEENTPEETQTDQDQVPLAVETPVLEPAPETDHEDPAEPEAGTEPEPEAKPEPQPAPEALPEEPPVESESIPNFPEEKGKDLDSKETTNLGRLKKSRTEQPEAELGPMWAPYQTKMVTKKGQVISTPKLIIL